MKSESHSVVSVCNPVDYTVHGILQVSILEWVAFPFSRGSSQPRDGTQASCIVGGFFTSWASEEAHDTYYLVANLPIIRAHVIDDILLYVSDLRASSPSLNSLCSGHISLLSIPWVKPHSFPSLRTVLGWACQSGAVPVPRVVNHSDAPRCCDGRSAQRGPVCQHRSWEEGWWCLSCIT